ncbi:MAG: ATP-binding cassette domain-containing protein [Candidatus Binataceae bacterium]
MTPSIELRHVSKRYDGVTAVDDLSFEVAPGRIFGLLGPNGAGKTSALRMMLGIMLADSGTVRMFGEELGRRNLRRAGYLPEERGLYGKMTVRENLSFFAQLSGLDAGRAGRKAQAWCERLGIHDRLDSKVDELSKGMQQKIQFAAAVIHDPEFIVMDEPFTGLDPVNVNELLLVSTRPEELMTGKIAGVGAVGLTQMAIWFALCGALALLFPGARTVLKSTNISIGLAICVVVFFVLGYLLYSALYAVAGAATDGTTRSAQGSVLMGDCW